MNPIIACFIAALFVDDYIFKEGKYFKMYMYAIGIYSVIYYLQHKSTYHSFTKKYNMAAFNQSFDPTVYAKVLFDITKAKKFYTELSKKTGKRINLSVFWIKVVGEVFNRLPECNETIRFGLKGKRGCVDIGVLVDVHEKDLANLNIRNVPLKTFEQISDELYKESDILKKEKNKEYNTGKNSLRIFPSFIIEILLEAAGILSVCGIHIPQLGILKNQYGSVILSFLGNFHLNNVYIPLCPFTQTTGAFACNEVYTEKTLQKDGTYKQREVLPVTFTLDHRYIDGALSAKMVAEARKLFDDPNSFSVK